jgi:hypothetical protein
MDAPILSKSMLKRFLTSILPLLVFNLSFGTIAFSQVQDDKEAQRERDVQIYVNKLGVGEKLPIVVKLKDGRKSVKGYISEINDDSFAVTDKKKSTTTTFKYSEVKKVSRDRTRTLLLVGVTAGVIVGAVLICVASGHCVD